MLRLNRSSHTLGAALAAFTLILTFSNCKRSSSDPLPNPADTTVKACLPLTETDSATGRRKHTYTYDSQRRLIGDVFWDHVGSDGRDVFYTTTLAYVGDTITTATDNPNLIYNRTKCLRQNGQFVYRVLFRTNGQAPDTIRYLYQAGRLVRGLWGYSTGYEVDSIIYTGHLPTILRQSVYESSGTLRGSVDYNFTYDTRKVGYSTYNLFSLAPGLDLVHVDRQITRVTTTPDQGLTFALTSSVNQDGSPERVRYRKPNGAIESTLIYTYQCP